MTKWVVIDADTHVFEPLERFHEYLDEPYKFRGPRVIRDQWGILRVLMEGRLYPDPSITVHEAHERLHRESHEHSSGHRHQQAPPDEPRRSRTHGHAGYGHGGDEDEKHLPEGVAMAMGRPGVTDAEARIRDLDIEGIDLQVILGSLCLAATTLGDHGFALAFSKACNDYIAEFCSSHPDRFKGVAVVPLQDVPAAIGEAHRIVSELKMVGVTIPPSLPGRNLDHPDFHPFYEAIQDFDIPICIHWGNGTYLPGAGTDRFKKHFLTHAIGHPFEQMLALASLVCGGILEKFPRLRFGFLESGCGWAPYWMWRLDEEYRGRSLEVPLLRDWPSSYLRRGQCFFSASPDEFLIPTVAQSVGAETIVFSSDYPHADSVFPNSVRMIIDRADLSDETKRKILGENAARLFKLN